MLNPVKLNRRLKRYCRETRDVDMLHVFKSVKIKNSDKHLQTWALAIGLVTIILGFVRGSKYAVFTGVLVPILTLLGSLLQLVLSENKKYKITNSPSELSSEEHKKKIELLDKGCKAGTEGLS